MSLLSELVLKEVEKCKAAGMNQGQILAHICNPAVAESLQIQAKFNLV